MRRSHHKYTKMKVAQSTNIHTHTLTLIDNNNKHTNSTQRGHGVEPSEQKQLWWPQKKRKNDRRIHNSYVRTIRYNEKFLLLLLAFHCWWQDYYLSHNRIEIHRSLVRCFLLFFAFVYSIHLLKLLQEFVLFVDISVNVTKWYSYVLRANYSFFFWFMTVLFK